MAIITTVDGYQVDTDNGKILQKGAPPPVVEGRTPTGELPRETKQEIPFEGPMDAVSGLVKNLSWGFNSALFALPDFAYKKFAEANGLKGDQITQLSQIFNRGEVAPKNSVERYSRAIGDGMGMTLPFTGVLAGIAVSRPISTGLMLAPEAGVKGIFKGLAKDTLDYIAANPTKAIATDLAFGAAYEGMKQAVEEQVSDSNPNKEMFKEVLPAAAFIGPAAWYMVSPTRNAASWVKNKLSGVSVSKAEGAAGLGEAKQEAMDTLPSGYKLPIINIYTKNMMGRAEQKLEAVFGPIAESPVAQQALRQLEEAFKNPSVADAFLVNGSPTLNFAEQTMDPALLKESVEVIGKMGPTEISPFKQHTADNQARLEKVINSFAPEARQPISEAFKAAQADRQQLFESLLTQKKNLTQAEVDAISQRLGPQDMNRVNDELRGVIAAGMEMDYGMRKTILGRMGLNVGYSPEGVALATRETGTSLFPAQDMEAAVTSLIAKYKIDRPSLRQNVPEPIRLLDKFMTGQQLAREQMESNMLTQLTDQAISEQLRGLPEEFQTSLRGEVLKTIKGEVGGKGRKRGVALSDLASKADAQGNISLPSGYPGRNIVINPTQLKADAAQIAESNIKVDINLPEALDYLASAQKFRNNSLFQYNDALRGGRMRYADADRYIKTGDAVYNDIERLILDHVPKINRNYDGIKSLLQDYRAGYEQTLPLLVTQKIRGGEKYLLPNEKLMSRAFESAENLKQLQLTLNNAPELDGFLKSGTVDWLRSKGVVNENGLIDPKKIRSVLDKNLNIVNALPANIQAGLKNEVKLAEDYVVRLGQIDSRRVLMEDKELNSLLVKASRTDADPTPILETALGDPAVMRTLVNEFGKDPEKLAALRRSVYDLATQGAVQKGGSLQGFLAKNEKSLKILFADSEHLNNMKILADLQRRVNALADVTGQMPLFEDTDQKLQRLFGFGIKFATTTLREAAVGRISPEGGALTLMLRLAGSVEKDLYKRLFTKALEDPKFAQSITHINTPKQASAVAQGLESIGIDISKVYQMPRAAAPHPAALTARQMLLSENQPQPEQRPQPTSQQMLRALPPAPQTRGLPVNGMAIPEAKPPAPTELKSAYAAMFPNDPISALIQQKMAQQPTQPPQGAAQ
jgi:hypothetical protein